MNKGGEAGEALAKGETERRGRRETAPRFDDALRATEKSAASLRALPTFEPTRTARAVCAEGRGAGGLVT